MVKTPHAWTPYSHPIPTLSHPLLPYSRPIVSIFSPYFHPVLTIFLSYSYPCFTLFLSLFSLFSPCCHRIFILVSPYYHFILALLWPHSEPIITHFIPISYFHPHLTLFSPYCHSILTLFSPYSHPIFTLFLPYSHPIVILFPPYSYPLPTVFPFYSQCIPIPCGSYFSLFPSYYHLILILCYVLYPWVLASAGCWLLLGVAGWVLLAGVWGCVHCNPRSASMSGQDACDACHVPRLWEGHKTISTDFEVPIKTAPFWWFWFINTHSVMIVGSVWSLESWECWDSIHVVMWQ